MYKSTRTISNRPLKCGLLASAAAMILCSSTRAGINYVAGTTAAPAGTLGGYTMTPFTTNTTTPDDTYTSSVPTPLSSTLSLSPSMLYTTVGDEWGTWSNNYTADVYAIFNPLSASADVNVSSTAIAEPIDSLPTETVTLPSNTGAFYLYVEPASFSGESVTVSALDTATDTTLSETKTVNGEQGATYFGFDASPGDSIASLSVSSSDPEGYAIGEFGIAGSSVPEPTSVTLIGLAGIGLLGRRRPRVVT